MTDYNKVALTHIRNILWDELQSSNILDSRKYIDQETNLQWVPIIPVQEQDVFKNKFVTNQIDPPPYIVYDLDVIGYDTDWVICKERITFKIYSNSYAKVLSVMNLMIDLFRRFDESAKDVNIFARLEDSQTPFIYHYFSLAEANSPNPAEELSGRLEADIAIVYSYSREVNSFGRFA